MKLTNQEIWLAYPNLVKIGGGTVQNVVYPGYTLPVGVSLKLAALMNKLERPYLIIENERAKLVHKYGKLDEAKKIYTIDQTGENAGDFAREFGELMIAKWGEEFEFEKIKLPEKVLQFCDACHKNLDVVFLIEPNTLKPLIEHFLEII